MTREELSTLSMTIISYSGVAKSLILEAVIDFKNNNKKDGLKKINEAEENLKLAGIAHFEAITEDAKSPINIDILYVHAEDQFMGTDTILQIVKVLFNIN